MYSCNAIDQMANYTSNVFLTGASSGIGLEIAKYYAQKPVRLFAVCRTRETADVTLAILKADRPIANIQVPVCNLENENDVLELSDWLARQVNRLDTCIFNAACIMPAFTINNDGIEKQLAVNHLSSFIICSKLSTQIGAARIVFLSSRVYRIADTNYRMILGKRKFYHPTLAYAETKLINLIFANYLAGLIKKTGGTVVIVHPGTVKTEIGNKHATALQALLWNVMKFTARTAGQAAADVIDAVSMPAHELKEDVIWYKGKAIELDKNITANERIARMLLLSSNLTGCNITA